ncbi:MAG TPA: hypothetical protein VF544_24470 [Pyrinomonadaceae bacterium]|jgi:hypothetical protein
MKTKLAVALVLLLSAQSVLAQQKPNLRDVDRVRIAEAFGIGQALGDDVWKGWDKAPFAVLLVTPEIEFLIRHPRPSEDFTLIGYDSRLQSNLYFRKRNFDPHLLATFPAVGGISTIVIGQAENTSKKTSTAWVVTMLHEHFHQLQNSQPGYYTDVNALNLSRGDETGMWMLNYAFPYSEPTVKEHFTVLSRSLAEALQTKKNREFSAKVAAYLEARRKFKALLDADDYRYFSFQVWQEGVARYTEYSIAELAAKSYKPSKEFRSLKDYKPFKLVADEIIKNIVEELTTLRLEDYKRVAFYPLGAGEALLLERLNPQWKERYFTDKFYVDKYFDTALYHRAASHPSRPRIGLPLMLDLAVSALCTRPVNSGVKLPGNDKF